MREEGKGERASRRCKSGFSAAAEMWKMQGEQVQRVVARSARINKNEQFQTVEEGVLVGCSVVMSDLEGQWVGEGEDGNVT